MTVIFLSTSDHIYVYLDIFLMGFHLSSTEWIEQEGKQGERERESIKEWKREWGNITSQNKQMQEEEGLRDCCSSHSIHSFLAVTYELSAIFFKNVPTEPLLNPAAAEYGLHSPDFHLTRTVSHPPSALQATDWMQFTLSLCVVITGSHSCSMHLWKSSSHFLQVILWYSCGSCGC